MVPQGDGSLSETIELRFLDFMGNLPDQQADENNTFGALSMNLKRYRSMVSPSDPSPCVTLTFLVFKFSTSFGGYG